MADPHEYLDSPTDADGHVPATLNLACPYCGRREISPILEYTGHAYSEHRDWTGTECDHCLAQWDQDGTARKGPHRATMAIEANRQTEAVPTSTSSFEGEILDEDGYPVQAVVDLLPRWTGTPERLVDDLLRPIFDAYGTVSVGVSDRTVTGPNRTPSREAWVEVRLVTGGWSGCEDAISAVRRGLFWLRWWETSHRGGVFEFRIPEAEWERPMNPWPMLA